MDWWPWGEAAFAEARRRDVPVFLSVGYATCHWCHVMERESFEDPDVAALLNEAFVCVKVDREERPDVDQFYMGVTQALTGSGGWPMTVALTPEREPFFAGTYFPKAGRMGRPGMLELVPALQRAWGEDRLAVVASAARIRDALAQQARQRPGAMPGVEILDAGHAQLAERFDPRHGGFGHAPKFPTPHDLSFLLRYHARTGEIPALTMVTRTLEGMRRGGLFDHVGFGFHRYSTDERWLLPHFEKMLYDQALLAIAYLDAWQATGEAAHARVVREIATYVLRDMTSPQGGFFSAEDADSEGVEGRFYLWTPEELREVLGETDAELVADLFGVEEGGNFRDQATGQRTGESILHLPRPLADAAARRGTDEADLLGAWDAARAKLFAHRERRERPLLDDKVLTDWNGLMIAALARAGAALDEPAWIDAARRAAGFVLDTLRTPEGRLLKRWRDGHAALPAVLDDHAFLAWGLLELWQATFEPRWLEASLATVETLLAHFHDAEGGGFFTTADDGEPLPVRLKEVHDGALPSGNSVAADVLLRLGRLTGRAELEEAAGGVFRAFSDSVQRIPSAHAHLLMALDFAIGPSAEIVIAGEPQAPDTKAMVAALRRGFRPNAIVILRPPDGPAARDVIRLLPWTADHAPRDGRATAYVCRGRACSLPTTDPDEMLRQAAP